ncbi:unnamed protein product [Coffea canephora]|uniref:Uncharacterized protein n=1 Tax=Coffea canephora TaxID=49390 RepID=A0A068TNH6_COFCA|nr:unnamed protein product [Coffea canephora]
MDKNGISPIYSYSDSLVDLPVKFNSRRLFPEGQHPISLFFSLVFWVRTGFSASFCGSQGSLVG